jgi:antirestriction protein
MREHHLIICVLIVTTIGLATFSLTAHADKLEGLDDTMQVLDDVEDLDKTAAYLRVPDEDEGNPDGKVDESEAADDTNFDDEFEHDVELEEDLMQDEDDFEDGDDVDDDRVSAEIATTP